MAKSNVSAAQTLTLLFLSSCPFPCLLPALYSWHFTASEVKVLPSPGEQLNLLQPIWAWPRYPAPLPLPPPWRWRSRRDLPRLEFQPETSLQWPRCPCAQQTCRCHLHCHQPSHRSWGTGNTKLPVYQNAEGIQGWITQTCLRCWLRSAQLTEEQRQRKLSYKCIFNLWLTLGFFSFSNLLSFKRPKRKVKQLPQGRSTKYRVHDEENNVLSCCWKISYTFGLLQFLLKINTDAADHSPFILISFFQEAFFSPQHTPFLPEEAWFMLEDVSVRMEPEGYF